MSRLCCHLAHYLWKSSSPAWLSWELSQIYYTYKNIVFSVWIRSVSFRISIIETSYLLPSLMNVSISLISKIFYVCLTVFDVNLKGNRIISQYIKCIVALNGDPVSCPVSVNYFNVQFSSLLVSFLAPSADFLHSSHISRFQSLIPILPITHSRYRNHCFLGLPFFHTPTICP